VSSDVTGAAFGPYVVEAVLGTGGMGVVYRARHVTTGDPVALKTLRPGSPERFASFRREVHALANLRHPGIVRILDHGVQGLGGGTPWYAMDLVEGRTLSHSLRSGRWTSGAQTPAPWSPAAGETAPAEGHAPGRPAPASTPAPASKTLLPRDELLQLFRRICRALAFLHAHGIVHRDLKPDNILVGADGSPILVDFGIVAQFGGSAGREVLDLADAATGTLAYMAPEQRLGRFVDARADLFSLGCILYECLTGRLPFGPTGLYALSLDPPVPPSAHTPGIPPELDAVVMRLLARLAQDRTGYADDVEASLAQLARPIASAGLPSSAPAPRTAYLYRPEFAGRGEVLLHLEHALADALSGRGVKALVTGESGAGKTRLVMELAARAAERGMAVIASDCPPVGTGGPGGEALGAPLQPLRGFLLAVADRCRAGGPAVAERLLGGRGKMLAPYDPAFRDFSSQSDPDEPDVLPPNAARARLLSTLKGLLLDLARERPLLLVLDDLQWADEMSLEFVGGLTPAECAAAPLAVVGTCRVEEMTDGVRAWTEEPGVLHAQLGRFDRSDIAEMVGGMLALRAPPPDLVLFLQQQSGGNPFFVAEYLRAAIGEGLLDRDSAGRWTLRTPGADGFRERVPFPPTITALIELRLEGLDRASTDTLHAAAVLGRDFDLDLVARTANLRVVTVLDACATLRQRHILEDDASGETLFVHDRLREIAYARIDGARLRNLHERAAAAIEDRYSGQDLDAQLGVLGYHHAKAGAGDVAARYFERAGDQARDNYANRDAVRFYGLALAQLGPAESEDAQLGREGGDAGAGPARARVRCRLQEALGDLLLLGGEAVEARAVFTNALSGTAPSERVERARRRRKLARTWERQHRHAEALAVYATAEEELGAAPGEGESAAAPADAYWDESVQIQVDKTWDLYFLGRVDELAELVERVRPLVERHGRAAQRAQFFQALAQTAVRRDRYRVADDTISHARASQAAAEETGSIGDLASSRWGLAFLLMLRGDDEEAEPLFLQALAGSERVGDAVLQTRFLSYYAILHRRLGRVAEARAAAERAASMAEKGGMFDYVGVSQANLCWAAWKEGRGEAVEQHATEALAAWTKLPPAYVYPLQWLARMPLAAHLVTTNRVDEAARHWQALLETGQHALPDPLRDAIELAISGAAQGSDPVAARSGALRVVEVAQEFRYM
jgi:serine/threonine protein kinase